PRVTSGLAAVIYAQDGDGLAMGTVEGATPTSPPRVANAREHNRPLADLFEPGSTNKLITLSTAIQHGVVTPGTWFTVPDSISVDPKLVPLHDAEPHPPDHWTTPH